MLKIIEWLAVALICGGGVTLIWYEQLSEEDQQKADRIAWDYAKQIYNKCMEELTKAEAKHVAQLTKRHFEN